MSKKNKKFKEKEYYREKIVSMVMKIKNEKFIKMIYSFTKSAYEEEKQENN